MIIPRSIKLAILLLLFAPRLAAQDPITDAYYSGQYREVIRQTAQLILGGDTSRNTFHIKALSEVQLGQTDQAIRTLEQVLEIAPGEARFERMLAGQYFEAGDYLKANSLYLKLVTRDSTDVSSWLKIADVASFRQDFGQATRALEKVLVIDSLNLTGLMMMGEILQRHNNTGAVIFYKRAFRIYPNNQKAAYALGNWHIQAKAPWEAVPVCEQILAIDSTSSRFRKLLGYAYYKMGDPPSSITQFQLAIDFGDSTAFTFKFKGICHYLNFDQKDAIESLEIATQKDSTDAEIHFFLGSTLVNTTRKTEAMWHLNRSLELMKPDPGIVSRIYAEQANIKRLEMEYEEAYDLYEQAFHMDTTNAMCLYYMASTLDNSLHRSREALVDYQRYLDLLDALPEKEVSDRQGIAVRKIVEDRIVMLKEELFFLDQEQ